MKEGRANLAKNGKEKTLDTCYYYNAIDGGAIFFAYFVRKSAVGNVAENHKMITKVSHEGKTSFHCENLGYPIFY